MSKKTTIKNVARNIKNSFVAQGDNVNVDRRAGRNGGVGAFDSAAGTSGTSKVDSARRNVWARVKMEGEEKAITYQSLTFIFQTEGEWPSVLLRNLSGDVQHTFVLDKDAEAIYSGSGKLIKLSSSQGRCVLKPPGCVINKALLGSIYGDLAVPLLKFYRLGIKQTEEANVALESMEYVTQDVLELEPLVQRALRKTFLECGGVQFRVRRRELAEEYVKKIGVVGITSVVTNLEDYIGEMTSAFLDKKDLHEIFKQCQRTYPVLKPGRHPSNAKYISLIFKSYLYDFGYPDN